MHILQSSAVRHSGVMTRVRHVVDQVDEPWRLGRSLAVNTPGHFGTYTVGKNTVLASEAVHTLGVEIQHDVTGSYHAIHRHRNCNPPEPAFPRETHNVGLGSNREHGLHDVIDDLDVLRREMICTSKGSKLACVGALDIPIHWGKVAPTASTILYRVKHEVNARVGHLHRVRTTRSQQGQLCT